MASRGEAGVDTLLRRTLGEVTAEPVRSTSRCVQLRHAHATRALAAGVGEEASQTVAVMTPTEERGLLAGFPSASTATPCKRTLLAQLARAAAAVCHEKDRKAKDERSGALSRRTNAQRRGRSLQPDSQQQRLCQKEPVKQRGRPRFERSGVFFRGSCTTAKRRRADWSTRSSVTDSVSNTCVSPLPFSHTRKRHKATFASPFSIATPEETATASPPLYTGGLPGLPADSPSSAAPAASPLAETRGTIPSATAGNEASLDASTLTASLRAGACADGTETVRWRPTRQLPCCARATATRPSFGAITAPTKEKRRTTRGARFPTKTASVAFAAQLRRGKQKSEGLGSQQTQQGAPRKGRQRKCRVLEESEPRQLVLLQVTQLDQSAGGEAVRSEDELSGPGEETAKDDKCTIAAISAEQRHSSHNCLIVGRARDSASVVGREGSGGNQMLRSASRRQPACSEQRVTLRVGMSKHQERLRQQHRQQEARSRQQQDLRVQLCSPSCLRNHRIPRRPLFERKGTDVAFGWPGDSVQNAAADETTKRRPTRSVAEGGVDAENSARVESLFATVASKKGAEDTIVDETHGKIAKNLQVLTRNNSGAAAGAPLAAAVISETALDMPYHLKQSLADAFASAAPEREKEEHRNGRREQQNDKQLRASQNEDEVSETEYESGQKHLSHFHSQESTVGQAMGEPAAQKVIVERQFFGFRLQDSREQEGCWTNRHHQPHAETPESSNVGIPHHINDEEGYVELQGKPRNLSTCIDNMQNTYRKSQSKANVVMPQPPQEGPLRKRQRQQNPAQNRQKQRQNKALRAYTWIPAFRQAASNFALRRENSHKSCSTVVPRRRVQVRHSFRLAKVQATVCVGGSQRHLNGGQLQRTSPQKDTARFALRQGCQQQIRLEQHRDTGESHCKPGQQLQAGHAQLWESYQVGWGRDEGRSNHEAGCTSYAPGGCNEGTHSPLQKYEGRRTQQQTAQQPLQITAHERRRQRSCGGGSERRQQKESAPFNTMRDKAGTSDRKDMSQTTETSPPRTLMRNNDRTCVTEEFSAIEWLGLRLERLLHWDEEMENYEELRAREWMNVLSGFAVQLKPTRQICGGSAAVPLSSGSSEPVEVGFPASTVTQRPSATQERYQCGREGELVGRKKGDEATTVARFFSAVERATAVVVEGKQDTAERAQRVEARKAATTLLPEQRHPTKSARESTETFSTLRAAAALPGGRPRSSRRIGEQLKMLQFLGQKEAARQLHILARFQGSEGCLHEQHQPQQGTPHEQQQRQQQRGQSAHWKLDHQREVVGLQNSIGHVDRGKLLFHDELSLLQRAFLLLHQDKTTDCSSNKEPALLYSDRPPSLQKEHLSQPSETGDSARTCRDTALRCIDDASFKRRACAVTKCAVKCGAAAAVCNALAKEGVAITNSARSLLPEQSVQNSWTGQRTAEEAEVGHWWERLGWTVYVVQNHPVSASASKEGASCVTSAEEGTRSEGDPARLKSALFADTTRQSAEDTTAAAVACTGRVTPPRVGLDVPAARSTGSFSLQGSRELPCSDRVEGTPHKEMDVDAGGGGLPLMKPASSEPFQNKRQFFEGTNAGESYTSNRRESSILTATRRYEGVDSEPPAHLMRLLDLQRRPLVCRLCGRLTLPEAQRGSVDAHVLHLLKRHRKLAALWALLLDMSDASHSVRRQFVKVTTAVFRRQQQHQRTRTSGGADATGTVSAASDRVKKSSLLREAHHQHATGTRKCDAMSSANSCAEPVQMEALRRSVYPYPTRTVIPCLRRVYRALLLQTVTAWRVRQLLQLLRQVTKFHGIHAVPVLQEMHRFSSVMEQLCEEVIAAKPHASVVLVPILFSLQVDGTLRLVLFTERQQQTSFTSACGLLHGACQQQLEANEDAFEQQVVCWTPCSFLESLQAGSSSESYAQLHRLLQTRHANASSPSGSAPALSLFSSSESPYSGCAEGQLPSFLQQTWPLLSNPRKPLKCTGNTREPRGLVLQAAGPCNEEFEVVRATDSSNIQRGSAARAPYKGLPTRLHTVGERDTCCRVMILPHVAGLCNTTSCRTAKDSSGSSRITAGVLTSALPPRSLGVQTPLFSNAAAPAGSATLLFPIIPVGTGSTRPAHDTLHDGDVPRILLKSFAAATAPSECAKQYLLHYVLTLASSRFLLPCVLRSIFCGKDDCPSCGRLLFGVEENPAARTPEIRRQGFTSTAGHVVASSGATAAVHTTRGVPAAAIELANRSVALWPRSLAASDQCSSQGMTSNSKATGFQPPVSKRGIDRTASTRSDNTGRPEASASWAKSPSGSTAEAPRFGPSSADFISTRPCVAFHSFSETESYGRECNSYGAVRTDATVGGGSRRLNDAGPSADSCVVADACRTEQAGVSSLTMDRCAWEHGWERTVQQPSTKASRGRSSLQETGKVGYDRSRRCDPRVDAQWAATAFPSIRSAGFEAEESADERSQNLQQATDPNKVTRSLQERAPARGEQRRLCPEGPAAVRVRHDLETIRINLRNTSACRSPSAGSRRSVEDRTAADASRGSTSQDLTCSHHVPRTLPRRNMICRTSFPLSCVHLEEEHDIASDIIGYRGRTLRDRGCLSSCDRVTRYSWYEAFSLVPQLPCGCSCDSAARCQRARAVPCRRFSWAVDRHVLSPFDRRDAAGGDGRSACSDRDERRTSGCNSQLRRYHLIMLQPSVAAEATSDSRAYTCDSALMYFTERFICSSLANTAPQEGLSPAASRQGAVGIRVTEVKVTSCKAGDDVDVSAVEEGARLTDQLSRGDCGIESLLQPVSMCFASFLVTCTSALPSAKGGGRIQHRRGARITRTDPAELHCVAPNYYKEAVVLRNGIAAHLGSGSASHADKIRGAPHGSTVACIGLCGHKGADNIADDHRPVALKKDADAVTLAGLPGVRPGFSSTITQRAEELVCAAITKAAAAGATAVVVGEIGRKSAEGGESESVVVSPSCFLSFACSYQSDTSRACLLEVPCCSDLSTSTGMYSSNCYCPLPAAQAAVVAAVFYGRYVSLCAELAALLLTNWDVGREERAAHKKLVQTDPKNYRQTSISGVAQSNDAQHQAVRGAVRDVRSNCLTDFKEKNCETRAVLLRLVLHQLRCPLATEIMARGDFSSLTVRTSCTDCIGLLRPLLRRSQLHELLRNGTTELLKADGATPESAAAFAACAAVRETLDKRSTGGGGYNGSTRNQASHTTGSSSILTVIRRLAALVLSNVLFTLFMFLDTQVERQPRRQQTLEPQGKAFADVTSKEVTERQMYSPCVAVGCASHVNSPLSQENSVEVADGQIQGHCSAPFLHRPGKRQQGSKHLAAHEGKPLPAGDERLNTGEGIHSCVRAVDTEHFYSKAPLNEARGSQEENDSLAERNARELQQGVHQKVDRYRFMLATHSVRPLWRGQTKAKCAREQSTYAQTLKARGRPKGGQRRWTGHQRCASAYEEEESKLFNRLLRTRKRPSLQPPPEGRRNLTDTAATENSTRIRRTDCGVENLTGDADGKTSSVLRDTYTSVGDNFSDTRFGDRTTPCVTAGLCRPRGGAGPPGSVCAAQAKHCTSRSNSRISGNTEAITTCSVLRPTSSAPSFPRRIDRHVGQAADPTTGLSPVTCETGTKQKIKRLQREPHNNDQPETPGCALTNVVSVCPTTHQECVDFGGFVRLCDDVRTGLHLQVTPFLAHIRRGVPLFIRHQLQRSGTRQSVLVDSFSPAVFARGDTGPPSKVRASTPVRARPESPAAFDSSSRSAHLSSSRGASVSAPIAIGTKKEIDFSIATYRQAIQQMSLRVRSILTHCGPADNAAAGGCDTVRRTLTNTVNSYELKKLQQQPPLEKSRQVGAASNSKSTGSANEGANSRNMLSKFRETSTVAATSARIAGLVEKSRIDLFAWDLLLENGIYLSRSHCPSGQGCGLISEVQVIESESAEHDGCTAHRLQHRHDNAVRSGGDVPLSMSWLKTKISSSEAPPEFPDTPTGEVKPSPLGNTATCTSVTTPVVSANAAEVALQSCKEAKLRHGTLPRNLKGKSSTSVRFSFREPVAHPVNSTTATGISAYQGLTVNVLASRLSWQTRGDKARSNSIHIEGEVNQQARMERGGRNIEKTLSIRKEQRQHDTISLRWDECEEENPPPTQATPRCELASLDATADGLDLTQPDLLLPTDGTSHSRLLAANWQAADRTSLALPTKAMQERNVSAFHGLVISEDGLLPENALLQLRRNELFFTVDQHERKAHTAALFDVAAARLGARIPSFLARTKILKLKKSNVHGWGVFAGEPICRDEFIVEYSSNMISDALSNFREWQYMQSLGGKTYFFKLKNSCIVDATHSGGVTRFINHSCTPNCRTQDVSSEGGDEAGAQCHLGLYALRDIAVGEELFYDYSLSEGALGNEACRCGAPICKGFM